MRICCVRCLQYLGPAIDHLMKTQLRTTVDVDGWKYVVYFLILWLYIGKMRGERYIILLTPATTTYSTVSLVWLWRFSCFYNYVINSIIFKFLDKYLSLNTLNSTERATTREMLFPNACVEMFSLTGTPTLTTPNYRIGTLTTRRQSL